MHWFLCLRSTLAKSAGGQESLPTKVVVNGEHSRKISVDWVLQKCLYKEFIQII